MRIENMLPQQFNTQIKALQRIADRLKRIPSHVVFTVEELELIHRIMKAILSQLHSTEDKINAERILEKTIWTHQN